ncbi:MAG: diacylglycerol/lipid kinase family protein [Lachnospiraceae bacterium]
MYHFIVNPASRSGRGKKYWEKIEPFLISANIPYQAHISTHSGHTIEIVRQLSDTHQNESLHLIVLGGDGTVNETLQGLTSFENVVLSYIPTGSSNDLARDLSISKDPLTALKHIIENPTERFMDLGQVHCENSQNTIDRNGQSDIPDRYFAVSCGIGYDAAICAEAMSSPLKNILNRCGLGKLTYLFIALKQLIRTKYITAELILDHGKTVIPVKKLLFLAAMNHKYEGGGFLFAPEANDHDGILNLCCVARIAKLKILAVLPTAYSGEHYRYDGVDGYQTSDFSLKTSKPLWVHTDGEVSTKADYISVKCKTKVIRFIY